MPSTLKDLVEENKSIIAPMITAIPEVNDSYSNYFSDISQNGYYKAHKNYMKILKREMMGTFEVPVVHCTYLIKRKYIDQLNYLDNTQHHEFIIFSRSARQNKIGQYICNKKIYGECVHFKDENIKLEDERIRLEKHELLMRNRVVLGDMNVI